jgi:imidazoleglycerol-phosphate dehydratase
MRTVQHFSRETAETEIAVELNLDGSGTPYDNQTGVGFFRPHARSAGAPRA